MQKRTHKYHQHQQKSPNMEELLMELKNELSRLQIRQRVLEVQNADLCGQIAATKFAIEQTEKFHVATETFPELSRIANSHENAS
jgi:hypothetical protein